MRKKTSKKDRIEAEKVAFYQRIVDIARGAHGGYSWTDPEDEDFFGLCNDLGVEGYGRYVGALRNVFAETPKPHEEISAGKMYAHWFDADDIHRYDDPRKAAEFMYEQGARA